jgi:hypothetical protein
MEFVLSGLPSDGRSQWLAMKGQAQGVTWFAYYNFCRVHSSLKKTPAMAQDLADHVWTIQELIA